MRKTLLLGAIIGASAPAAMAQEALFTGNISLVSDYQFRNVTQTNHDMTIQGGIDVNASGFYVGMWASGVDFDDASDVNLELDGYLGYRFDLAGFGVDLGAIYYAYPDAEETDLDFYEVYGKLSRSLANGSKGWASIPATMSARPTPSSAPSSAPVGTRTTSIRPVSTRTASSSRSAARCRNTWPARGLATWPAHPEIGAAAAMRRLFPFAVGFTNSTNAVKQSGRGCGLRADP
jgi:hypothetical protein